jgi:hypothetical protein
MARWDDAWEDWRIEDLELKPLDDDRVLSLLRIVARGKGSGIGVARDDASITELRDGKVVRITYYNGRAQARGRRRWGVGDSQAAAVKQRAGPEALYACRTWCAKRTASAPSPTALATRFVAPARTSPAANTPGQTVSRSCGGRSASGQRFGPSHVAAPSPHLM